MPDNRDNVTTYIFPQRPVGIDVWPRAPYPVNCTSNGVRTAQQAGGITTGCLRLINNGVSSQWEIFFGAGWTTYSPSAHQLYANIYYRIGPCWVGGHGHGSDGEVSTSEELYFPVVHNHPPTEIEKVDIRYYPVNQSPYGLYWLRNEWQRLTGNVPVPVEPEPTPTPTPTPEPVPTPTPTPEPTPTPVPSDPCEQDLVIARNEIDRLAILNNDLTSQVASRDGQIDKLSTTLDKLTHPVPDIHNTIKQLSDLRAGQVLEIGSGWKARLGRLNRWFKELTSTSSS